MGEAAAGGSARPPRRLAPTPGRNPSFSEPPTGHQSAPDADVGAGSGFDDRRPPGLFSRLLIHNLGRWYISSSRVPVTNLRASSSATSYTKPMSFDVLDKTVQYRDRPV